MSLTPVPPRHCTGCPHAAHPGKCPVNIGADTCPCGIATLPVADHHTADEKLDTLIGLVQHVSARLEWVTQRYLEEHEVVRKLPDLEREVASLRERVEEHDRWERDRAAGSNGGTP